MSNIFDMFETDIELEKNGVKLVYGINSREEEMQITVARAGGGNIKFQKVYERVTKPYRRQLDTGIKLPKEVNDKLNRELYAEAVVRSASGFEERDGTPIDTSTKEGVMNLFLRLPNLFSDVINQSHSMELYRSELRETEAKN